MIKLVVFTGVLPNPMWHAVMFGNHLKHVIQGFYPETNRTISCVFPFGFDP